jgi:hypothetical protein
MSSARTGVAALAAVALCAVVAVVAVAATDERRLAFTIGVQPSQPAAVLAPGDRACQSPIDASAEAQIVKLKPGTFRRPGPPLAVETRTSGGERATGTVPGGYADLAWQPARLDRSIPEGQRIEVCVVNRGPARVALFGGPALAARTSAARLDGRELPTDIALVFEREDGKSVLSLLATAFERAALWHPGWAGDWLFWVLLVAVTAGVPVLLAAALRASSPDAPGTPPPEQR